MDSISTKPAVSSNVKGIIRTFAKVLRFRVTGIAPDDGIRRIKSHDKAKSGSITAHHSQALEIDDDEKLLYRAAMEALLAKLFASISSVKAAYAELQIAQSPYDAECIHSADEKVVAELKSISELKQCFLKKQIDPAPQVTLLLAEIQEQQSLMKTYEIMMKKFESQLKLKNSEITLLRQKLEDSDQQNMLIEKKLNPSGPLSILDGLHLSGLNPTHFLTVLKYAIKSIRSFVKLVMDQMESAGWDFDAAVSSIEPGVVYAKQSHKCFAFESFVCREMFDGFHYPNFSLPNESLPEKKQKQQRQNHFFERFTDLKSEKPKEFLARRPNCTYGKFCRTKYLHLVHPKMESSFFGDVNQRNLVNSGKYPETPFFAAFAEMAKRVWLLHCLAFSFDPEASIFKVKNGSRFSEVFMETVTEDTFLSTDANPRVGFTVLPGFKIGKTIIQCQVYLSPAPA